MNRLIGTGIGSYSFSPEDRLITLENIPVITLDQIVSILNVTRNVWLYYPGDTASGVGTASGGSDEEDYHYTQFDGKYLFLQRGCDGMEDTDYLRIEIRLPDIAAIPYPNAIAGGYLSGKTTWSKIGFVAGVNATERDVAPWMTGPYVYPTGALTMTIVSSSDNDDPAYATPTGAWTVTVYYLNTAFEEKTKTVTLIGKTPVNIATDMYRVQNARVATCGTTGWAIGNLTIASGGITYGYISATKTRMRQCVWTVPAGKVLYVTQIAFSSAKQAAAAYARFTTRANFDDKSGLVLQRGLFMPFHEIITANTAFIRELDPPTKLPATVDLKVSVASSGTDTVDCTCALRGWTEYV